MLYKVRGRDTHKAVQQGLAGHGTAAAFRAVASKTKRTNKKRKPAFWLRWIKQSWGVGEPPINVIHGHGSSCAVKVGGVVSGGAASICKWGWVQ